MALIMLAFLSACQQAQAQEHGGKKGGFQITPRELAIMQAGAQGQDKDLSELMLMQENPEGYRQYKLQKTLERIEQKNFHCTSRPDDWGNVRTDCN
jgi:hypothetical protein